METYFKKDSIHKIYQKPLSQEDFEDKAVLIECIRPSSEFNYGQGLVVEEWNVQFIGEKEIYPRIVTEKIL